MFNFITIELRRLGVFKLYTLKDLKQLKFNCNVLRLCEEPKRFETAFAAHT